jgi:hypothetical protein
MAILMQIIGFGWAILGAANLIGMFSKDVGEGIATIGLLVNVLLFILPGLVVGSMGVNMKKRQAGPRANDTTEQERIDAAVKKALDAERKKSHPSGH